ncbi:hypothetical protein PMM47T1_13870 [Pseudomonas sp. M47T1]|uniref:hypothetical protein n=1 Tax=Pseudomonas sp. M47T1 TaxID=1179778 RepID=UPI00026085E9|nr:hypothetical protein [Pseudomonas sp. M47T1]EIK96052.1 hypothetical protein PMM47T1_13870 [Pseudomonas sp. M47T1]
MAQPTPINRGPWPNGIDNRSNWRAVPGGSLRDSVNVDPLPTGHLNLRSGYELAVEGTALRGALAVGRFILLADGTSLRAFNVDTNTTTTLATIAGAGRFVGDLFNDELFFCTENQTLRFKDGVLRDWGVTTVSNQPVPTIGTGGLLAGEYQCAVTFVDAYGDEGGTVNPLVITVTDGASLDFTLPTPPSGGAVRLYVGPPQASTLFLQYEGSGTFSCSTVAQDTARLETDLMRSPVVADFVARLNGVIAQAEGKVLWLSAPLRPHLREAGRRFFQFAADIDGVVAAENGLFVLADQTYFISGVETDDPSQVTVFPHGGVRGSMVETPDNHAAWMTPYGLAKTTGQRLAPGSGTGMAALISAARFLPEPATSGASGVLELNGNQLVVSTMHRAEGDNPLRTSDYYEAEIVTP